MKGKEIFTVFSNSTESRKYLSSKDSKPLKNYSLSAHQEVTS